MPTTARLVAAILMAGLAFGVAELIKPYLPPEMPVGLFAPISAGVGLGTGWLYTGRRLDRGLGSAVSVGLTSILVLVFWVLLIFSMTEMTRRSLRKAYGGPVEAVQDIFAIAIDYLKTVAQADVVAALVVGGLVIGSITRWVAARYR